MDRGRTVGEKLQHFFATKLNDDQVGVGGERGWGGQTMEDMDVVGCKLRCSFAEALHEGSGGKGL